MPSLEPNDAARRAECLLWAHLNDAQRDEYQRCGAVTIEKRGPVPGVLARNGALSLLAAVAAAQLPLVLDPALAILVALPLLAPAFLIACCPRRLWRIDPNGPQLLGRCVRVDFCVSFDEPLPSADRILAFKNILEASEAHFLRTANIQRVRLSRGRDRVSALSLAKVPAREARPAHRSMRPNETCSGRGFQRSP